MEKIDKKIYIGDENGVGYHIIHWDRTDHKGKRYAVRLINSNDGIPFVTEEKGA